MNIKEMFNLDLPEQVPYLGFEESYFIGNGVAGCGGLNNGIWDYCFGCGYGTIDNFFKRERLKIYIDQRPYTLQGKMYRAKGTGVFYSLQQFSKAAVCLVDFALRDRPYTARLIAVKNTSDKEIIVHPYAEIKHNNDYSLGKGTHSLHILKSQKYWLNISFGGCDSVIRHYMNFYRNETIIEGNDFSLSPGELRYFTLFHDSCIHSLKNEQKTEKYQDIDLYNLPFEPIDRKETNGVKLLEECLDEWNQWNKKGIDISFIQDTKCRYIVESTSIFLRMLQGQNGGVMAMPRVYTSCYLRDSFCAMKGLLSVGHFEEVKNFLRFQYKVFKRRIERKEFGVPTATRIGDIDDVFMGFGDEENWACESPGLFVIISKDYYHATGDIEFLKSIEDMLIYCVNIQLELAEKNNWKMYFNGDETESQGNGAVLKEQVDFDKSWWSMPSSVICIASAEFIVEYLQHNNKENSQEYISYKQKLTNMKEAFEKDYWNEDSGIYQWYRTKNGNWPQTLIPNYHILPLYLNIHVNKKHIISSAENMIKYWNKETGFIPNQVFGENDDFCGHNMGYLLYMAAELRLREADAVYESLVHGKSVSAYGMWCETYYDDGTPYQAPTTDDNMMHNLRGFESGMNLDAIIHYWKIKNK